MEPRDHRRLFLGSEQLYCAQYVAATFPGLCGPRHRRHRTGRHSPMASRDCAVEPTGRKAAGAHPEGGFTARTAQAISGALPQGLETQREPRNTSATARTGEPIGGARRHGTKPPSISIRRGSSLSQILFDSARSRRGFARRRQPSARSARTSRRQGKNGAIRRQASVFTSTANRLLAVAGRKRSPDPRRHLE